MKNKMNDKIRANTIKSMFPSVLQYFDFGCYCIVPKKPTKIKYRRALRMYIKFMNEKSSDRL